ncbi:MAG: right-handed parallel beta-helix repeat-containing protein [Planctomycetes bacterium]|nr:right-handed parallel beta-helix repeat-containing protein [Planctomycetota bacterium]
MRFGPVLLVAWLLAYPNAIALAAETAVYDRHGTVLGANAFPSNRWIKLHEINANSPDRFQRQEHGGSCFDSKRGQIVLFGSDTHGKDWHNSPRFFDTTTTTWSQPYSDDDFKTYSVNERGIGVAGPMGEHPWAMHTFGAVVYDSARDELIAPIFDDHLVPGRFTGLFRDLWPRVRRKPTWVYRFAAKQWMPLAGDGINCFPYCATYDCDRQVVVGVLPDGIYELAGEPRAWRKATLKGFFGWHTNCAYDRKNKAVVVFGSNEDRNDIAAYFPATGEYRLMPTAGLRPPPDQHNPMEFCPDVGKTVVLVDRVDGKHEQTETWLYDVPQDTWTQVSGATLPFACGMNYNLEYDGIHRRLLLVTGPQPTVWALRLESSRTPSSENAARPEEIQVEPATMHCLSVRWPVLGDANGNCVVEVQHRKKGEATWKRDLPLFRTLAQATPEQRALWAFDNGSLPPDRIAGGRLFAGSIVDLAPDTEYEARLTLKDPDGGGLEETVLLRTRSEPLEPEGMRIRHVVPGNGGGTGEGPDPFRGLETAFAAAAAGDLFLLHGGVYRVGGTLELVTSGTERRPIVFRAAGDGAAVLDGGGDGENQGRLISANGRRNIWLENLTLQGREYLIVAHESSHLVVRRCRFQKMTKGIVGHNGGYCKSQGHFFSDNVFSGPTVWPRTKGIEEYAGICVSGAGHEICYNRFEHLGDGIHGTGYGNLSASDIHHNDIHACTDDGIETDYAETNVRVFRNRIVNAAHGVSAQPAQGGPLYFFRNLIYNATYSPFKLHNHTCGVFVIHNTCLRAGSPWPIQPGRETVTDVWTRNNLFLGSGHIGLDTSGRMTRCDFDGDGYGGFTGPFAGWNGTTIQSVLSSRAGGPLYSGVGAVIVTPATCFAQGLVPPTSPEGEYQAASLDFRLDADSDAVDRGVIVPNFSDGFRGRAPDLGAHELGDEPRDYGPRSGCPLPAEDHRK